MINAKMKEISINSNINGVLNLKKKKKGVKLNLQSEGLDVLVIPGDVSSEVP